ncbi:MAG: hypothetical protein JNM18_22370 [Planctomycetaceae bacterium]|nr:hypothetical protein [Planctomycetaceae bacterium]
MSSTLTPRPLRASDPARQLRGTMAAVRLSFTWFGTRKTLTSEQKSQAAESFGAAGQFLSAGKKLLDTRHPAFQAVTGIRTRLAGLWRGMSLPYPEPGIRLIRQADIEFFHHAANLLQGELTQAVAELDAHFEELKAAACERLGQLFNAADYPQSLRGLFAVEWDFPSLEPPAYLRELNPELFRQEQARVAARFEEAVQLAEEAFIAEFGQLVGHLTERLSGHDDGRPKIFRDSVIENLRTFFERFQQLNVRNDAQLDELVAEAQRIVQGVAPQRLREDGTLRQSVASQLSAVQSVLDGLLVDRPRRRILRSPK